MTMKYRLLVVLLMFGMLPIVVMFIAAKQTTLGLSREFHSTMAIGVMVTSLAGLISPGLIRQWLFSNRVQKMKEFCQSVKDGHYDVVLPVPTEHNSDGDDNELVGLMRDMNWMVHRIKTNEHELRQVVVDLEQSRAEIQMQKKVLEEVNAEQLVVQEQLEGRTLELKTAVDKLRNLLDNAGQGFLTFGEDLRVAGEYSAECVMIFNREIQKAFIPALLYPQDAQQQTFLTALLEKVFQEEDAFLRENYLSLLPEELEIGGSYIQIAYKLIVHSGDKGRKEILLILTDITQKRAMEQKIAEEKNMLAMVVKVITHQHEFMKIKAGYELFCGKELPEMLSGQEAQLPKIHKVFRIIHTWKGTFAQIGMRRVVAQLHELESALGSLRDETEGNLAQNAVKVLFTEYSPERLAAWLEQEVEQLREVLGNQFLFQDETIVLESSKLYELEEKIRRLLTPCQAEPLIEELRRLRYKPFRDLIDMLPEYIADLAVNQGKEIAPLRITGAEALVDPIKYHDFAQALVHVFRNAVAHGLETPDERLAAGKQPQGRITCHIKEQDAKLVITIADDGRGIDDKLIRRVAIAKGICSEHAAYALAEEEAIRLILADGFSSADSANELSGRGVGLAAVKQELDKLGGHLEIMSVVGKKTKFAFILPVLDTDCRMSIKGVTEENGACACCG